MAKILLVDDDRTTLQSLSHTLSGEGYLVEEAQDGAQAVRLIDEERFDLVLTDIRMPKIDGFGVLDHVRSSAPDTPLIMMTGDPTVARIDALSRGATDCLLKPLELEQLMRRVEEVLSERNSTPFHSRHFQANRKPNSVR